MRIPRLPQTNSATLFRGDSRGSISALYSPSCRVGGQCTAWVLLLRMRVHRAPWTLPGPVLGPSPSHLLTFGVQHGAQACAGLHTLELGVGETVVTSTVQPL